MIEQLRNSRVFWFGLTGGIATVTHVSIFVLLVEAFRLNAVLASIPSFLLALAVSYYGNRSWTFKSTTSHVADLPKYTIVAVSGLVMNILITYSVVDLLHAPYAFALFLVITIVPVVTYWLCRRWVFSNYVS